MVYVIPYMVSLEAMKHDKFTCIGDHKRSAVYLERFRLPGHQTNAQDHFLYCIYNNINADHCSCIMHGRFKRVIRKAAKEYIDNYVKHGTGRVKEAFTLIGENRVLVTCVYIATYNIPW